MATTTNQELRTPKHPTHPDTTPGAGNLFVLRGFTGNGEEETRTHIFYGLCHGVDEVDGFIWYQEVYTDTGKPRGAVIGRGIVDHWLDKEPAEMPTEIPLDWHWMKR